MKHRVVVLISGSGTNLQAIIDAVQAKPSPLPSVALVRVVSNRKDAYGLVRAEKANIPTQYFPLKPFTQRGETREQYDAALADSIAELEPDLIVLAGWMHILSLVFLDRYANKVINLHPALPGQFDGAHAIERAFQAAQEGAINHSGVMVHHVIPEVDRGSVILQQEVPILKEDTLEAFETRVHATEHKILVQAISKVLVGTISPHAL